MQLKPEEISKIIRAQIKHYENVIEQSEVGTVILVGDGIARASGLEKCMAGELLQFDNGEYGMAQNLEENTVSIVLLGSDVGIKEGSTVKRTGKVVSVPVGEALIGRVVNALGQPIDGAGPIETTEYRAIESKAPGIIERQPVKEPLQTGIKAIDSLIPICCHRPEALYRGKPGAEPDRGRSHGLYHRGFRHGFGAVAPAVYRTLLRLCHGRVLHASGQACPDHLR